MKNYVQHIFFFFVYILFIMPSFSQDIYKQSTDSIISRFYRQYVLYPQEKIYLQTDKTFYIAGEDIWFRAHLIDAQSHKPDSASRYVYVELINPLNEVVKHVKVKMVNKAYQGYIPLTEDLPDGDYTIRCYTRYMENTGEAYFYRRGVRIGGPLSALYRTEASFRYEKDKKIRLDLSFRELTQNTNTSPNLMRIYSSNEKFRTVRPDDDGSIRIQLKESELKEGNIYVECDYQNKIHKQFIAVPPPDDEYDVSFYPEGGNMVEGVFNRVGFKALNSSGMGEDISGVFVDDAGNEIGKIQSEHLGMGSFWYMPVAGKKIYVVCHNKRGIEKKVELPEGISGISSLQAKWVKNDLDISVGRSSNEVQVRPFYLIVLCRGVVVYATPWSEDKKIYKLQGESLPTGVIQLLLVDDDFNPVSERLVFNIHQNDLAKVSFRTEKDGYGKREEIKASIGLSDIEDKPLSANFSISVTADKDVMPDTCTNILSTLLLTSDIRGYIESPAYYFSDNPKAVEHLDNLMLTQGWSRYNVSEVLKGNMETPKRKVEVSQEISGTVKGGLLLHKDAVNYPVTMLSLGLPFFDDTTTDEKGKFSFRHFELPDSTEYIIQAKTKKGSKRAEITLEEDSYPPVKNKFPVRNEISSPVFENYLKKAEEKFVLENGIRMVHLKEAVVTAQVKKVNRHWAASPFNERWTSDKIEKFYATSIFDLLMRFPGLTVQGKDVYITRYMRGSSFYLTAKPYILVDNMEMESDELETIHPSQIEEIEVAKGAEASIFGSRGGNGVILITTKTGPDAYTAPIMLNVKTIKPLGYQVRKEFYSPKYETKEQIGNSIADLRSTIYWKPDVETESAGKASISFYSADSPGDYSVIIEGVTSEGLLIYGFEKISVKK